jgi:polyhydroxyalkanoate synthesis repressor PhaR
MRRNMTSRTILVKRYSNRRLYDTTDSRYITLQDLAERIRGGADVRVVDAKTNEDLTQATLTQIIIESRGAAKLLPVPLLVQLIRLGDAALAEFFGRYMSLALELYLQAKRGAQAISAYNPFASVPFDAASAFARMFVGSFSFGDGGRNVVPATAEAPSEPTASPGRGSDPEIAALRKELAEIKESLAKKRR